MKTNKSKSSQRGRVSKSGIRINKLMSIDISGLIVGVEPPTSSARQKPTVDDMKIEIMQSGSEENLTMRKGQSYDEKTKQILIFPPSPPSECGLSKSFSASNLNKAPLMERFVVDNQKPLSPDVTEIAPLTTQEKSSA